MRGYSRGFRTTLFGAFGALLASGVLLIPTTLVMRLEWEPGWRLSAAARIGVAALHVGAAFMAAALLGSLWTLHMRAGWRQRRNHRNGALLVMLFAILGISGLGIFYLADETPALWTALAHTATGLLIPAFFIYHMIRGQRIARRALERSALPANIKQAVRLASSTDRHQARVASRS